MWIKEIYPTVGWLIRAIILITTTIFSLTLLYVRFNLHPIDVYSLAGLIAGWILMWYVDPDLVVWYPQRLEYDSLSNVFPQFRYMRRIIGLVIVVVTMVTFLAFICFPSLLQGSLIGEFGALSTFAYLLSGLLMGCTSALIVISIIYGFNPKLFR